MIQVLGIVEDALARVTGDDLVVLANLLKHLRPNAHLTDFAHVVPGRWRCRCPAKLADAIVPGKQIGRHLRFNCLGVRLNSLKRTRILLCSTSLFALLIHELLVFLRRASAALISL